MTNGESGAGQSADPPGPASLHPARPLVVALLLLIIIAGVGAASPPVSAVGPWHGHAVTVGVGLEVVLAGLQLALLVTARRGATAGHPAPALRQVLRAVIAVVMVVIVVIAVANIAGNERGRLLQRLLTGGHKAPAPRKAAKLPRALGTGSTDHFGYLLYGLLGVIVLAALVACVILAVRARTRPRRPGGYADEAPADDSEDLRQAVLSGRAALRAVDDARAAIIACYVAMEASLGSAGAARAATETPDELLIRAAAAGLIRGPAAARLTGLFYEARFSTHPIAPAARDEASQALDVMSAELADRPAALPAGTTAAAT